jgi:hypothetical protein
MNNQKRTIAVLAALLALAVAWIMFKQIQEARERVRERDVTETERRLMDAAKSASVQACPPCPSGAH